MYKAGDYQFVVEEHPTNLFDEVSAWLNANYFSSCVQVFQQKQITSLYQMVQQLHQSDLEQMGCLEPKEIDRFMNLILLMKEVKTR